MTVGELIILLRQDLLDDSNGENLWPDDQLLRIVNEAQRQACSRGDYLFDTLGFPITALTERYPLDPGITRIVRILVDGKEIHRRTRHELDDRTPGWRTATTGETFAVISGRTVQFTPIPQTSATCAIEVYRMPKTLGHSDDELEIIPEYQADLVNWCLYRCLSKRDVDTFDKAKAIEHLAMFDSIFGKVVPATVRQHQLSGEHSAVIRPIPYSSNRNRPEETW